MPKIKSEPDYASLERKIASGKTIELAAAESGMDFEVAKEYLDKRRTSAKDTEDDTLLFFSNSALKTALAVLTKACKDPDRIKSETAEMGGTTYALTDIDAAKALLNAGLAARKMLDQRKNATSKLTQAEAITDLFDLNGPWVFKEK